MKLNHFFTKLVCEPFCQFSAAVKHILVGCKTRPIHLTAQKGDMLETHEYYEE